MFGLEIFLPKGKATFISLNMRNHEFLKNVLPDRKAAPD